MEETYLFQLTRPWWEIIFRAGVIYIALFAIVRLFGKREIGNFTPFDFIFLLLLGASVGRAIIGGDRSLTAAGIALGTLVVLNFTITWVATRFMAVERIVEGSPELLVRRGVVDYEALRRNGITKNDLLAALRKEGCETPSEVTWAVLETSGEITAKKASPKRAAICGRIHSGWAGQATKLGVQ